MSLGNEGAVGLCVWISTYAPNEDIVGLRDYDLNCAFVLVLWLPQDWTPQSGRIKIMSLNMPTAVSIAADPPWCAWSCLVDVRDGP